MKVSLFANPSYLDKRISSSWPVPPRYWDPQVGALSMKRAFEVFDLAHDLGFDWFSVAEHHYFSSLLGANPMQFATALASRYDDVTVAVLGSVLAQNNPVRVAEEFATLDAISNGRLIAGIFRGIPNEYLAYGTNPREARAKFDEAFELILRAWAEPEPFWWEGRYYRFPIVSVWPRPVQDPRPPILCSGTSPASATFAARNELKLGLSLLIPPQRCAELVSIYLGEAEQAGWLPAPDDILYRARVYVAESDREAERHAAEYELGDLSGPLSPPPERVSAHQRIMAELSGEGKEGGGFKPPPGRGSMPEYYGSPETVARQIAEAAELIGYGVLDYSFDSLHLPHEMALRSLELFGHGVLPQLQRADTAPG